MSHYITHLDIKQGTLRICFKLSEKQEIKGLKKIDI